MQARLVKSAKLLRLAHFSVYDNKLSTCKDSDISDIAELWHNYFPNSFSLLHLGN